MPRSAAPSRREGPRPPQATRFGRDEAAVSEVVGQILVFGILSVVLVLSMVAFQTAKDGATERGVRLQAEAMAQQVVTAVVDGSLFAERHGNHTVYERQLEFPELLEDRTYTIHVLRADEGGSPDRIRIEIPDLDVTVRTVLFSAGAPEGVDLCGTTVPGGPMRVVFGRAPPAGTDCGDDALDRTSLFLEERT